VSTVVIGGCSAYREPDVTDALEAVLEPLGGMAAVVRPGERILLKPNLLAGRPPDRAVTTHPLFVAAVARLVRKAGATPVVGDSPGLESTVGAAHRCGLTNELAGLDVELVTFDGPSKRLAHPSGRVYRHFDVAEAVLTVDGVLNLPKLKTHGQMALTLGVKNTLGCVVGMAKAQWHLQAGTPEGFARMLLDLNEAVAPRLTILDGVVAMQGNGPFNGTPVHLGLLAASTSSPALDAVVAAATGYSTEQVPTLLEAGLDVRSLTVERRPAAPTSLPSLVPAAIRVDIGWVPFAPVRNWVRRACTVFPRFDDELCVGCNKCADICPAKALTPPVPGPTKVPTLDLHGCIRCFCCQEICPAGAVTVGSGWFRRLVGRLF